MNLNIILNRLMGKFQVNPLKKINGYRSKFSTRLIITLGLGRGFFNPFKFNTNRNSTRHDLFDGPKLLGLVNSPRVRGHVKIYESRIVPYWLSHMPCVHLIVFYLLRKEFKSQKSEMLWFPKVSTADNVLNGILVLTQNVFSTCLHVSCI